MSACIICNQITTNKLKNGEISSNPKIAETDIIGTPHQKKHISHQVTLVYGIVKNTVIVTAGIFEP
jgi:hypothetical protein